MNTNLRAPRITRLCDRGRPVAHLLCTRPRCRAWHAVTRPRDVREGDMYAVAYVREPRPFAGTPIQRGDVLIYLITDDVSPGDLITLRYRGNVYTGFLEIEGERWLLTDGEGEPVEGYFTPSAVSLAGRCVEVQRAGEVVEVSLRAAHDGPAFAERRAA